ncbi:hypothetical protein L1049_004498 [Liquidambar formosana]|uniref:IBH1-like N-terminal domain-containing protein n=1 Tax=Liquidambar formosana TaxID=63359 RepID=A0AAP0RPC9_LIQFO
MDSLGWHGSPAVTNMSSTWSNQRHKIEESSFRVSNSNCYVFDGKMDLAEAIFDPTQDLQKSQTSHVNSNSDRVSQMVHQLAPALDSINVASNLNLSQRQEAIRLAADTVLAKSGTGTSWGQALTAELCSNSSLINRTNIMNPFSCLMADFGKANQSQFVNGFQDGKAGVSTTGSLESLDCLLSATNSNTDNSVEDDGVSMVFTDCSNLWNFGELENNGSIARNKEIHCTVKELDETVYQGSLDRCVNRGKSSETKPNSIKRSINDQSDVKVGANYHCFNLVQLDSSAAEGSFQLISEHSPKPKKSRSEKCQPSSSNINFQQPTSSASSVEEPDSEAIAQMKEMIYRAAAFRPVNLGLEVVEKPKRKNVRISTDPQTVAARQRRERISERIRVLQTLVPGAARWTLHQCLMRLQTISSFSGHKSKH